MTTEHDSTAAWQTTAPPPMAPPPRRSGWVTAAAVVLITTGAIAALMGLMGLLAAFAFGSSWGDLMRGQPGVPPDVDIDAMVGVFAAVAIGFSVISLIWAAAHFAAGAGILGGREWGRITGIVLAILGGLLSLLFLALMLASFGAASEFATDPAFREELGAGYSAEMMGASFVMTVLMTVPFLIGYVVVLVVLIRNGAYFGRRPTAPPG